MVSLLEREKPATCAPSRLRVEAIESAAALRALAPEWRRLFAASAVALPFATFEWADSWWGHMRQERRAVTDERTAVNVFLNQFRAGTVAFTTVVVAEVQLLADEEAELTARQNLFLASVNLIVALGGGWDVALLPTQRQLQRDFSLLPQLESQPSPVGTIPSDILVPPPLAPPPAAQ